MPGALSASSKVPGDAWPTNRAEDREDEELVTKSDDTPRVASTSATSLMS